MCTYDGVDAPHTTITLLSVAVTDFPKPRSTQEVAGGDEVCDGLVL